MGRTLKQDVRPFTRDHLKDRDLVIRMLKSEEELAYSDQVQDMYRNILNRPRTSLNIEKALNRMVLSKFNFDTSDESVANYRLVFKTYFRSPDDYDKEVIGSSYYMRNNKCVFYKRPKVVPGDTLPNVELYGLNGTEQTSLYDEINPSNRYTIFAAFSLS